MIVREKTADFEALIKRVREGSQEAAWDLIAQYAPQVLRVVRRRLPQELRQKFDSEDFVQTAWISIFKHPSRLAQFTQPREFVAFLNAVAGNKVGIEVRRRLGGQRHNVKRERSLEDMGDDRSDRVAAREPRPSQIAVAREQWFQLLKGQPRHYRRIIELRYMGQPTREIATQLGLDDGTVRRALRKMLRDVE
jgi:RNA polymerase sigma factor (sigma-70 family)